MNRRELLKAGCGAAVVATAAGFGRSGGLFAMAADEPPKKAQPLRPSLTRHRFGVHYAPPRNWFFLWNDFNADVMPRAASKPMSYHFHRRKLTRIRLIHVAALASANQSIVTTE